MENEIVEANQNSVTPIETEENPPTQPHSLAIPLGIGLAVTIILGVVIYMLWSQSTRMSDENISDTQIAVSSPTAYPSPTISPLPTTAGITSSKVSPKPSASPTMSPKPSPSPTVIVDNTFTCGKFETGSYPPPPATGQLPLYVTLFPSGGTAGGVSLAGFEWDFDGDGNWEGGVSDSKVGRTYDKQGKYQPKYRVKGNNGAVGPTCVYPYTVEIGQKPAFENDMLMVDSLNKEVVISKSQYNYTFTGWLAKLNNDPAEFYVPFVNLSLKKQSNAIFLTDNTTGGYGSTAGSYYMEAGTSWPLTLRVSKNMPFGTYEGSVKVEYSDSQGINRYSATTVTYKITYIE